MLGDDKWGSSGLRVGPLLFLIFVNHLPDEMKPYLYMFADDAKIMHEVRSNR